MADLDYRVSQIERTLGHHERDLYRGNGKPALTERIRIVEDCVDRMSKNLTKLVWLVLSTLLTTISAVVLLLIERGVK